MEIPYFIKKILEERKITSFLGSRNYISTRSINDKLAYHCPIHSGDNDPSFIVYTNDIYENFYCYGCHAGGNIINLISEMDKKPIKQVIRDLAKNLDIKEEDILDAEIQKLEQETISSKSLEEFSLKLSRYCYDYFKTVDFNIEEMIFFEKVFEKVDSIIHSNDIDNLRKIYNFLIDQGVLKRYSDYLEREENVFDIIG